MPEPDKHRKAEDETLDESSLTDGKSNQPPSTPGKDAPSSLTEVFHPKEELDTASEDSFDRTVLTKSPNAKSMGRLGKYDVIELIGQGGMGVVLKGFDESLERHVAIKMLSRQLATSPTARRRFTREGRAVAAVNHPNVITIHAVEEQDGLPFLVMELVEGGSLHERIKKDAPLPLEVVLRFGSQIANGLAAAHTQGVIHRDIKPGNVMLEQQVARVKITDFGLARITMDNSDLTSQGNQLGTPAYMSPEQVHGRDVDDRTDLFSLGCVMYAMIAGHSPFRGTHAFDAARKILEHTPPSLNEIDDDVPLFLPDIVSKLLEKDPKKRYQTAEEVGEVLNHYLARLNQTRTDELHTLKEETLNFKSSARPNRRLVGVLVLLLALIAIGATSPLWFASPEQTQDSQGNSNEKGKTSPPVVPRDANIITVSKAGAAQFKTIGEALANAAPGMTIRVLDGSYKESLVIDNAGKWRGVQIVADANASLSGPPGTERVIAIMDTANVVIKGFIIRPRAQQFAIKITGNCEGVTIDEVNIETPDKNWAAVYITRQARGSKLRPIEVRNSRFDVNNIGVDVEGKAETGDCITDVAIKNNRFSGDGNHILLVQSVRSVEISGNTFAGGKGVVCALAHPDASESIQITNNTFFENNEWLFLGHARPDTKDVSIRNNLIVGSARIGTQSTSLSDFATSWDFSHNLWEPGTDTDRSQIALVAEPIESVDLVSRDPQHAKFLHPSPNSRLAGRGTGGKLPRHIGAFEPSSIEHPTAKSRADPPLNEGPVDLLARIEIERDTVAGSGWQLDNGRLITGIGRGARLQMPSAGLSDYELQIVATRREQTGPLVIGLVVGDSQCYLLLDAARPDGSRTAFGLGPGDNLIETKAGFQLLRDQPTSIVCRVTPAEFRIVIDDKEAFHWTGSHRDLKLGAGWKVPDRNAFFVGTNDDAIFEISKLQLSQLSDSSAAE